MVAATARHCGPILRACVGTSRTLRHRITQLTSERDTLRLQYEQSCLAARKASRAREPRTSPAFNRHGVGSHEKKNSIKRVMEDLKG
jgi:hypothetical protein